MAQAHSHLSASHLSVEQVAGAINGMIAERAAERLRKAPDPKPAPETPALKAREPGVYFDLPMAAYHADPSLGSTDLKALLVHPACYWQRSHMNPERRDDSDTPAKKIGRALHALVLEGEAGFARAFAEEPTPDGYPGCLVTLDDLKAKCREIGEPVSGTKAELGKRIKSRTHRPSSSRTSSPSSAPWWTATAWRSSSPTLWPRCARRRPTSRSIRT
jgi:hypothetical protein